MPGIRNTALLTYALDKEKVWFKSTGNEGHFTEDGITVFRPCLASHCNVLTEASHLALSTKTSNITLPTVALQAVHVWFRSVGNERRFTLESERVFLP
jgi:hypothetical protein